MADQEVTNQTLVDHPHKRKLDDLDADDVAPRDSSPVVDGDVTLHGDSNGGDADTDGVKRPRFDDSTDGFVSTNGLKADHDDDKNAEVAEEIENTEASGDDESGGNEKPNEAVTEEADNVQPSLESEPKVDGENDVAEESKDVQESLLENEQLENANKSSGGETQEPVATTELAEQSDGAVGDHVSENGTRTRRIVIPNNKVGVLIGKAGDTIKYLQINSGAKIQITRDAEADPRAPTRPVELVGSLESLNKAEKLIRDVIAEADAGGSPSLVARGFTANPIGGSVEIEMLVASEKVGLIIGKGGETIRSLQTRSGARIQLIPQSSSGDQSKEKVVKVTGDKRQVETARELIKEVMNQPSGRQTQFSSNNYNQQPYRPRGPGGPGGAPQWGPRGPQPTQYDYHHQQRGPYPSQNQPYPGQSYGNYPPQGHPRGGYGSGWEQRPPAQGPPPHAGGYEYYGQGGHGPNAPSSAPQPSPMSGHASSHQSAGSHQSHPNYNYGQPRGADYPQQQPASYPQMAPPAQSYNQGYGEPKYEGQGQVQQPYGGPGYGPQQHYTRPQHGGYAPPASSQPVDPGYQAPAPGPVPAPQPYAQNVQAPQQYPYASGAMTQAPYGSAPVAHDGYTQPQAATAGYPQQGAQPVGAYGQQAAASAGYPQAGAPATGYTQYPSVTQPGYTDPSAGAASYGYQAQPDPSAAYGAGQAYNAASAVPQQGYAQPQPVPAQPGYDQSGGGYAGAPVGAPPAGVYGKTVSPQPQPGYPQYDASQQMYAAPR